MYGTTDEAKEAKKTIEESSVSGKFRLRVTLVALVTNDISLLIFP